VKTSDRPCGRKSSCLAFAVTGKGEARTALLEGTEAGAAGSISKASGVGVKERQRLIQRTAVYGPVCTVVWEGRSREAPHYPDWLVLRALLPGLPSFRCGRLGSSLTFGRDERCII
jgi:hypothetical protein